jgi:hypothetical protein
MYPLKHKSQTGLIRSEIYWTSVLTIHKKINYIRTNSYILLQQNLHDYFSFLIVIGECIKVFSSRLYCNIISWNIGKYKFFHAITLQSGNPDFFGTSAFGLPGLFADFCYVANIF